MSDIPETWDRELAKRVNNIESVTSMEGKPELEVLISIFYMLYQIKQQLDTMMK